MVVTGMPRINIWFSSSTPVRQATYDAARSTGTRLVFSYTVQKTDGGNASAGRLTLGDVTIRLASDARAANI